MEYKADCSRNVFATFSLRRAIAMDRVGEFRSFNERERASVCPNLN